MRAAQVIGMMLIRDHSRMKFDTPEDYDDTGNLQWRLMPTSHPEEYDEFVTSIERGREASTDGPAAEPRSTDMTGC